jgi:hypothetical protein
MSSMCSKFMPRAFFFSVAETCVIGSMLLPNEATASSKLGVLLLLDSAATTIVLKKLLSPSL